MSMGMEVGVFLAYAFGALTVYILGRYLLLPLKWITACLINSLLGGMAILVINYIGSACGLFIPLNGITALVAGILGVPGIIALTILFV